MLGTYLVDTIDIITRVVDQWGIPTETTQHDIKARVEDKNVQVLDQQGREVAANIHVLIEKTATISYQSKIILKTRAGVVVPDTAKEWPIKSLTLEHGFVASHWEAWL